MSQDAGRKGLIGALRDLFSPAHDPGSLTESLPLIDDALVVRILDLSIRIGETMLATGAPANEVALTITKLASSYGLRPVHIDVTYNSIGVAHHRSGTDIPITLMRVVRVTAPDHAKLQLLQALVAQVQDGLPLDAAITRFRTIRKTPFRYRQPVIVVAQAMLAVGVAVMFGATPLVVAITFVASALAALVQAGFAKARVPYFFSQIAGAFVLTLVAALTALLARSGVAWLDDVRPSVIVASGIVLMLAGLTVVGAAQDAIDGFALTALGRILELMVQTLGVVLGILAGLETARVLGFAMEPPDDALPLGSVPLQLIGAVVIAIAVAVYNGARSRIIVVSAVLSLIAWLGYLLATTIGLEVAAASGFGAFVSSLIGVVIAHRLHVPSVAITTAAILPMVPGAAVFRGLLAVVESNSEAAQLLIGFGTLSGAAIVGISLAVGASLGIYLGQPISASLDSVIRSRARVRR